MNKEEFFKDLNEIITDPLYFAKTKEELSYEIQQNTWSISAEQSLVNELSVDELRDFFKQVEKNRHEQVLLENKHSMIFYVWFDSLSARLRFNAWSDFGGSLPFGCAYKVTENLDIVLNEFLSYSYHDGLIISTKEQEKTDDFWNPLMVYAVRLDVT